MHVKTKDYKIKHNILLLLLISSPNFVYSRPYSGNSRYIIMCSRATNNREHAHMLTQTHYPYTHACTRAPSCTTATPRMSSHWYKYHNVITLDDVAVEKKDLEDIQGLISVDRSSKATQPLTIPRPIQVVYKGSSPRNRQVW